MLNLVFKFLRIKFLVIFVAHIASCSSNETKINLVCSGIQSTDMQRVKDGYEFPNEKKVITKTFKFSYENKAVTSERRSETKKLWVFHTSSFPEIYEEDKRIVVENTEEKTETIVFKNVVVAKDDISVTYHYSRADSPNYKSSSLYNLDIDRVSGKFKERETSKSPRIISSEVFEGTCVKAQENKI
jgi:hypothetical protein